MTADDSRSEQVVAAYKRHKLAVSALHHIRRILRDCERGSETDRRLAWYGIAIVVALLALAALARLGVERIFIS